MEDPIGGHPPRAEQLDILVTAIAAAARPGDTVLDLGCCRHCGTVRLHTALAPRAWQLLTLSAHHCHRQTAGCRLQYAGCRLLVRLLVLLAPCRGAAASYTVRTQIVVTSRVQLNLSGLAVGRGTLRTCCGRSARTWRTPASI